MTRQCFSVPKETTRFGWSVKALTDLQAERDTPNDTGDCCWECSQLSRGKRAMSAPSKLGKTMPNDSHQRAAEFHELAAHAHRAAAAHHGKEDHLTGHEHSEQALEHAKKAWQFSQKAHVQSSRSVGKS